MDLSVKKSWSRSRPVTPRPLSPLHHDNTTTSQFSNGNIGAESTLYNQLLARYLLINGNPAFVGRDMTANLLSYFLLHRPIDTQIPETQVFSHSRHESRSSENLCESSIERKEISSPHDQSPVRRDSEMTSDYGLESLTGDRKRISRPLTGRYVRHGTGASPSTLTCLRRMLHEKIRLRETSQSNFHSKKNLKSKARKRRWRLTASELIKILD